MEKYSEYSAEITEIIGTPPRLIIRAGGGVLLGIFLLCLALASVVQVPEQHSVRVLLSGSVPPYYVRQVAGGQRVAALGDVVQPGQMLLCGPGGSVAAPFAGRLLLQDLPTASPGDTVGLLLPLRNTYRFGGTADLATTDKLASSQAIPIQVTLNGGPDGRLLLHGYLSYFKPAALSGHVSYVGQLDSLSNVRLAQHRATVSPIEGELLLTSLRKPLLQSLLK